MSACGPAPEAQAPLLAGPELSTLAWLEGQWRHEADGTFSEEQWSAPRGGLLLGMNRTVKDGVAVHFEALRIEQRPDGIFYVADPSDQPPASFRLQPRSGDDMVAVFQNLDHDFPQTITYRRDGDALSARVEGEGRAPSSWTFGLARGPALPPLDAEPIEKAPAPYRPKERLVDEGLSFGDPWPRGEPTGLDRAGLDAIVAEAARTESDALLIVEDGKVVVERYFDQPVAPIETMSMTKSIVSLGIGLLIADGKISGLDAPLSTWFDDWKTGAKAKVTLRHVLTHTSGLAHRQGARVLNQQKDRLAFVRKSDIVDEPGTKFSYSNEAVQLLSGVAQKAAGKPLDQTMQERLFTPLGIADVHWEKDEAGNVQTFYGLHLKARDLARIGQMMLDGGQWQGKRLVEPSWIAQSTTGTATTPYHGLLWWIRRGRGALYIPGDAIGPLGAKLGAAPSLKELGDRRFHSRVGLWLELGQHLDARGRDRLVRLVEGDEIPLSKEPGPVIGYAADGWLGQQLIVLPKHRLVVVRQHRAPKDGSADDAYNQKHGFFDLIRRLDRALSQPRSRPRAKAPREHETAARNSPRARPGRGR